MAADSEIKAFQVTSGKWNGWWYICKGNMYLGPNGEWTTAVLCDGYYRETESEANEAAETARKAQDLKPPP
ncbi:MAG: hypothetical protein NTY30_02800 [Candidatus Berkelbacteria bacterium]|nr:hypothetical protein [Candidatus Berkelbacteria bacterium]